MAAVDQATLRPVVTPEGLVLPFRRSPMPERIGALIIDGLLIILSLLLLTLFEWLLVPTLGGVGYTIVVLAAFVIVNFYFAIFEMRPGGATPGKRLLGLRVISRDGGPLTSQAVLARNLTRNIETIWPLILLFNPKAMVATGPGWGAFLASLWIFVFALMPFFNRDRLRVGDLIGGTLVVLAPRARLAPDMADTSPLLEGWEQPALAFTAEQLDHYGVHELQVLEDVLRRSESFGSSTELVERVAARIQNKIGWETRDSTVDAQRFLSEFYRAQRKRLEDRMLLGKRRESKYDRSN